ncbi:MAG TPA: dienelactone hydrolase family protein [Luteolibacter sp.]
MSVLADSFVDLATRRGPMRVHLFLPLGAGKRPAVIFYSEIFQVTGPIRRMAAALAGEGYVVAVPEVYHEFEPLGTVLAYDQAGSDRGNALKFTKEIDSFDEDTDVVAKFLLAHEACNGRLASYGVCLGGHLAVRAGLHEAITAVVAFYPTDIHTGKLGAGNCDDTFERMKTIDASLFLAWGRQDPHVPVEGRRQIHQLLEDHERDFEWHEFNAAHAFLRDEGNRYNPALARVGMALMLRFLEEKVG